MFIYLGELAALATSILFSATSTLFTLAGRKVGPGVLNRSRLLFAILFILLAHWLLDIPLPFNASPDRWFWLSLSGVIGLALGDAFLFRSYIAVGPRLGMLMMALAPVIAALLAWPFFGETLTPAQVIGMVITLSGVGWVVMERNGQVKNGVTDKNYPIGILAGLAAATGQAVGLITAKGGLYGDFPALSGTLIRMLAAGVTLWALAFMRHEGKRTIQQLTAEPRTLLTIITGALVGPTLGVTMSLVAIQHTKVGIASTLMALPPVILLPVAYFFFRERFGWQAVAGTLLAVTGVAVLFLV